MISSAGQLGNPSKFTCARTSSLFFGAAIVVGADESSAVAASPVGLEASADLPLRAPVGFFPDVVGFAAGFGAISRPGEAQRGPRRTRGPA